MKLLYMGTPDFAAKVLARIFDCKFCEICGVFTKPDKINKRGNKVEFSPVKKLAIEKEVPIFQPQSLKSEEVYNNLKKINPELILVVAYGKILPKNILELPKLGCINLHGSILPKYRGSAPVQRAIINGEKSSGVTTMFMDEGMDTGDIIFQEKITILPTDSAVNLFEKMAYTGANLVTKTLSSIASKKITRTKQNNNEATYAPPIKKEEAFINFEKNNAENISNLIRGLNAGPVAYTTIKGKRIKIFSSEVLDIYNKKYSEYLKNSSAIPGEVLKNNDFIVCCKDKTFLKINQLQPENKNIMSSSDYLRGNRIFGEILGN